jgi:predicted Rossmann fold flavoprotein
MIVIIGAGASGLLASILLSKKGHKVVIIEKDKKVAKKLRTTGNGKCNITNLHIFPNKFHSNTPELIEKFIVSFKEVEKTFLDLGIPFISLEDGRCFPMSLEANAVADILEMEAKKAGVKIVTECEVSKIKDFEIFTNKGNSKVQKLIIATGSKAGFGSSKILENFKFQTIYPLYPSLVQLKTKEEFKKCAGVKIKAKLTLISNGISIKSIDGDLLFTNYGISGLAVLDISEGIAKRLADYEFVEISIDFFPEYSKEKLKNLILLRDDLRGIIPAKLIPFVKSNKLNTTLYNLKNFRVEIIGTREERFAEVMSGGISLEEINENMESKKMKNLYFLGEILDVDGDRGGYNLHFAWSTAIKLVKNF